MEFARVRGEIEMRRTFEAAMTVAELDAEVSEALKEQGATAAGSGYQP